MYIGRENTRKEKAEVGTDGSSTVLRAQETPFIQS